MEYRSLGNTDLKVSAICLGTMTWGEQNTEAEGHAQMDYALERGVNFWDVAEMYPVPPRAETQGRTEAYIGTWFASRKQRDKVILATKVTGRSKHFDYLRGEETRLNRKHMEQALEGSLKRLQTDYVDLYQLHWPDRLTNHFGQRGFTYDPNDQMVALEETLSVLDGFIKAGKVRHIGVSNETPWGVMHALKLHESKGLPCIQSIQNPYSLLNRLYEVGLSECSIREQCGLLAYSPLACGMLTGKYRHGAKPEGARITLYERYRTRYGSDTAYEATERYAQVAEKHGLSFAQMALAFINQQPFVTSNIIGATNLEQLKENIDSIDVRLDDAVIADIEAVQKIFPDPCP